ncbi:MAG: RNA polymerase subunit sigma-24, partial [Actinomycetota bacterium]|nr:RNA polymerase subunit sigma-24 [Actinomycetota bacterium]
MGVVDPVELAAREHWGRVLALLIGQFRRLDLAEDCLQDAFVAAAKTWPDRGTPSNPAAWLLTTARRRAIDVLRAESTAARKVQLIIVDGQTNARSAAEVEAPEISDERLRLIFTCCHPA